MRRRDLGCVLIGVLLTTGAFAVRGAIEQYYQLEARVAYMEGYLAMLDKLLRGSHQ
jgi:hypothetical protein